MRQNYKLMNAEEVNVRRRESSEPINIRVFYFRLMVLKIKMIG